MILTIASLQVTFLRAFLHRVSLQAVTVVASVAPARVAVAVVQVVADAATARAVAAALSAADRSITKRASPALF